MSQRPPTRGGARRKNNRRLKNFLWIAGFSALVIALLYFEQTAILYLLATLGLTALLVVVAMSDLSGARKVADASELGDDSAAISDGITGASIAATASAAPVSARRSTNRRK
jgi:hypothetical protein